MELQILSVSKILVSASFLIWSITVLFYITQKVDSWLCIGGVGRGNSYPFSEGLGGIWCLSDTFLFYLQSSRMAHPFRHEQVQPCTALMLQLDLFKSLLKSVWIHLHRSDGCTGTSDSKGSAIRWKRVCKGGKTTRLGCFWVSVVFPTMWPNVHVIVGWMFLLLVMFLIIR